MKKLYSTAVAAVVFLSGCSGIVSVGEFKEGSTGRAEGESALPTQRLAACLTPYLEKSKFFLSGNTLDPKISPFGENWQSYRIYATNADYTMYVVEITPSGAGSHAILYYGKNMYGVDGLVGNFNTGMSACERGANQTAAEIH